MLKNHFQQVYERKVSRYIEAHSLKLSDDRALKHIQRNLIYFIDVSKRRVVKLFGS